ncbi:MAG: TetR/AcrR family transcriptional regulator, partial [Phenylobacterium sp.]
MARVSQEHLDARRRQILDGAARCFARNGFHATSMADVCAAAEMSPGNLYRYFRGKDEIIRAIVERDRAELVAWATRVERHGDIVEALAGLADDLMRRAAEPGYARIAVEVLAEAGRDPQVGEFYRRTDAEVCAIVERALAAAARAGRIDPGLDCKAAAQWLMALGDGIVARLATDREADRQALVQTYRRMVRGMLGGR